MSTHDDVILQHLIDPELCIRCNTCEETCPSNSISNDLRNYVVDVNICNGCKACVDPCPTGAINVFRPVPLHLAYTREQQFEWSALPEAIPTPANDESTGQHASGAMGRGQAGGVVENRFTPRLPAMGVVAENVCVTPNTGAAVHHIVLDLSKADFPFLEGQSVGVMAPGCDAQGAPHAMRLYSVACSRDGEACIPGQLALTVKRVREDREGENIDGICSNFLCDLKPGDEVKVAGPYGADFLLPEDEAAALIMICTGTGIAPMRAMLQRRKLVALAGGPQVLFYGGRRREEMAYCAELEASFGPALERNFAYSRQAGKPKRYVQDLLRKRHELLAGLLARDNTHVYLCGLRGMEDGVFEAFAEICSRYGKDWGALADEMARQRRLHVETY